MDCHKGIFLNILKYTVPRTSVLLHNNLSLQRKRKKKKTTEQMTITQSAWECSANFPSFSQNQVVEDQPEIPQIFTGWIAHCRWHLSKRKSTLTLGKTHSVTYTHQARGLWRAQLKRLICSQQLKGGYTQGESYPFCQAGTARPVSPEEHMWLFSTLTCRLLSRALPAQSRRNPSWEHVLVHEEHTKLVFKTSPTCWRVLISFEMH